MSGASTRPKLLGRECDGGKGVVVGKEVDEQE